MAIKRPTYEMYDEYIHDYDTSNSSFISMASIMYRKGIENHSFFLKLYDEDLVGVDPHDPNLSYELKLKVIMECRRNFYYFAREVMKIPAPGGEIRFKLNRGNLAAMWSMLNGINTYLVMPRQFGKTWIALTFLLWTFNFGSNYCKMLFMNKALRDSQENLKRLKDARDLLPDYLQMKLGVDESTNKVKEFTDNVNELKNAHKNEIITKASARNPQAADNLGRGLSLPIIWFDEIAFLPFNDIIWAAAIPAWRKSAEVARENGVPTGLIITTTPGDLSTQHGNYAYQIKELSGRFTEDLYDMDAEDIATWMDKNAKNKFIYIEYRYQQLNLKDPEGYFKEMQEALQFNWPKIRREVLLQWNNSTSNSPFDPDDLLNLRGMMLEPDESQTLVINKYYRMNVYRPIDPREKYIITVDPAKGRGEKADNTAIVIVNARTQAIHAVFKSNTIQYKDTYRFLYTLVLKHVPNSVIVVENNIDTVIEYLKNSPLKHLVYYEFKNDVTTDKRKNGVLQQKDKNTLVYGINTNNNTRKKYFDLLFEYVHSYPELINVEEMVQEIEALEYKTADRIESASSKHDDVVLSYLLGLYVLMHGTNKARFGLFFSEALDSSINQDRRDAFSTTSNIFEHSTKSNPLSRNPFFIQMMYEPETLDDIERKLARSLSRIHDDEDGDVLSIFDGNRDEFGMNTISSDAFDMLNTRGKMDEQSDDLFGAYENNVPRDFDDIGSSWF